MDYGQISTDQVFLKGLRFDVNVGLDAWQRPNKSQPAVIDLALTPLNGLGAAAQGDDVSKTLDYGKLYKAIVADIPRQTSFRNIHHIYWAVYTLLPPHSKHTVTISLPKALVSSHTGLTWTFDRLEGAGSSDIAQALTIPTVPCRCIIGVNPHERLTKQRIDLSIEIRSVLENIGSAERTPDLAGVEMGTISAPIFQKMMDSILGKVEASAYETVEALATAVCQLVTMNYGFGNAKVTIEKPSAIAGLSAAGVTISRSKSFFENKDFWKIKRP